VQVLVPDAVEAVAALLHGPHQPGLLGLVLGDDEDMAPRWSPR